MICSLSLNPFSKPQPIKMTDQEKAALAKEIGKQTAEKIDQKFTEAEQKAEAIAKEVVAKGAVSQKSFDDYKTAADAAVKEAKDIIEKQGTTLQELSEKLNGGAASTKSIAETLEDSREELRTIYNNGQGVKHFMVSLDANGRPVMKKVDLSGGSTKAAGTHATVAGVGGVGVVASVASQLSPSALLRASGINPVILNAPRNTPFLLDLVNLTRAGFEQAMAVWFEEIAKEGSAAVVAEGAPKPLVQYKYEMKTASYKKVAQLLNFTDEFVLDFERIQNEILGRGLIDLNNVLNATILADVVANAVGYNTATQFKAGEPVPNVNDYDVIAALKTQVKNSQFGLTPNGALMSAFKEGRMAITKDANGAYLNRPDYLNDLSFIGNPAVGTDQVVVGDFTNYNVLLRGGILVKVGYNGTDMAENKFSVVQEQYYQNYIADVRKETIVKGPDFATVKAALAA